MSAKQNHHIPSTTAKAGRARPAAKESAATDVPNWAIIVVLVFTGLLYSKALDNGITFMDDDYYVLRNQYLRDFSFKGIKAIFTHFYSYNYHPFTTITLLLEYTFFKLNPLPYHLTNVALHLLNTWLAFKLTEHLSGKKLTALVVAMLFALHPMHVESVAWISERKDVLYTAFYLSSLLYYLRYMKSGQSADYAITLLLFLASLLSKSAAVTLPVLLVVIDVYKGRPIAQKTVIEKIPFLLLSILFGILAIKSQQSLGAINDLSPYGFVNRIFLFTSGLASYFLRLVFPVNLSAIHYFPTMHNGTLPWYYYLSLPLLLFIAWLVARRSSYRREILFGTAFFLVTISVMLQIVTVGAALTSERYTYVPYIGLFYITGQWLSDKINAKWFYTAAGILGFWLLCFSVQTWSRIGVWKDSDVLFTDITQNDPDNWHNCFVYYYWGMSKNASGMSPDAIEKFTKAIQLKPDYERAYYSRGGEYDHQHDFKAALADYNKALTIDSSHADVYNARGWTYFETSEKMAAMRDFDKAIRLNPSYAEAYNNRGWVNYQTGDTAAAISDYIKSKNANPEFDKPYLNKALISVNKGDDKGALDEYSALLKIQPDNDLAYLNRGLVRMNLKDKAGACEDFKKSADLGNKDASTAIMQYCH